MKSKNIISTIQKSVFLLIFLFSNGLVFGQVTFSAGGLPAAIPDPGNLSNTITVSGLPGTVATADEVQINVAISHAWASDIVIGVTPPGGTEIIIVNRIGGGMNIDMNSANVLSFRANAAAVVTVPGLNGIIPAGIYLPSGANAVGSFSSFVGATRNGNWIIRVRDDDSIIQGSLQSASISFFGVGSACPDPPTASVSTQPTCAVPTGTITVTAPANGSGVSYTLTGTSPVVAAATNATGVFSGLASGTYEVVSIVSGCTSPAATLVVNAAPATTTYYADVDQDGFGDPANTTQACSQPGGYVTDNSDCNDLSAVEKPGQIWYKDTDGDVYAETGAATLTQCFRPVGYKATIELTSTTGDCNDNNNAINPAATEICDGIDNDCDGLTDEGVTTRYYYDFDGDGYGENGVYQDRCSPSGFYNTTLSGDCDNSDISVYPNATELCDGKDNDCDGMTDEGLTTRYYYDFDGDGYGENGAYQDRCSPSGFYNTALSGDCDNSDNTIYPNAPELCDGKDNDCDGLTDEIYLLPCGWSAETNGAGCNAGNSATYNTNTQRFTVTSTKCYYSSSFSSDALAFAQYDLCGNGSITAQVTSITGGQGWAGITMRESNAAGAKKAQLMTNLSTLSRREFRTATGGQAYPQQFPSQNRYWLRITRTGNQFVMSISQNGTSWYPAGAQNITMSSCIEMGLVVTNYNSNSTITATFANVSVSGGSVTKPVINPKEDILAVADFSIMPNPSNGWIEIDLSSYSQRKVQMELYNLQGKLLRSTNIETGRGKEEIDLTSFANGMYLIRVRAEGLPDVTKRVVMNSNL